MLEPLHGAGSREAAAVTATPRPGSHRSGPDLLARGADRHQLLVDAERGVGLSAASHLDGEPFALVEVREIAFTSETIEAATLVDLALSLVPAAGEPPPLVG